MYRNSFWGQTATQKKSKKAPAKWGQMCYVIADSARFGETKAERCAEWYTSKNPVDSISYSLDDYVSATKTHWFGS